MLAVWPGSPQKACNPCKEAPRVDGWGTGEPTTPLSIEEPPSRHREPVWLQLGECRAQNPGRSHGAGDVDAAMDLLAQA